MRFLNLAVLFFLFGCSGVFIKSKTEKNITLEHYLSVRNNEVVLNAPFRFPLNHPYGITLATLKSGRICDQSEVSGVGSGEVVNVALVSKLQDCDTVQIVIVSGRFANNTKNFQNATPWLSSVELIPQLVNCLSESCYSKVQAKIKIGWPEDFLNDLKINLVFFNNTTGDRLKEDTRIVPAKTETLELEYQLPVDVSVFNVSVEVELLT